LSLSQIPAVTTNATASLTQEAAIAKVKGDKKSFFVSQKHPSPETEITVY
jgi:hypothetical protein